ncbi:hypothetical protein [Paenibacillus sp. FSL W7-1287]|uniref:hypothetical protein n=1 Tax=Paenibacillus sp. FSL W7-1287 TaxID=2954538 RepID=UPI0030F90599
MLNETKKPEMQLATEQILNERQKFIILGLTGKTASGCTTTANLLKKTFQQLNPPSPKKNNYSNNDERKYEIVYQYASKKWKPFEIIKVRDVITTFILDYDIDILNTFLITSIADSKYSKNDSSYLTNFECDYLINLADSNDIDTTPFEYLKQLVTRNPKSTIQELFHLEHPIKKLESNGIITQDEINMFLYRIDTIKKIIDFIDKNENKKIHRIISDFNLLVKENLRKAIQNFTNDFASSFRFLRTFRNHIKKFYSSDKERIDTENLINNPELYLLIKFYYFELLPYLSKKLENAFSEISPKLFSKVLQRIGNNIRSSGTPYSSKFNSEQIFALSIRLNNLVKMIRDGNRIYPLIQQKKEVIISSIQSIINNLDESSQRSLTQFTTPTSVSVDDEKPTLANQDEKKQLSLTQHESNNQITIDGNQSMLRIIQKLIEIFLFKNPIIEAQSIVNSSPINNIDKTIEHLLNKLQTTYVDDFLNNTNSTNTFIVIDAFRNPYEVSFFKDRYSGFHLISINTDEKTRSDRLMNQKKLNIEDIKDIDATESPSKLNGVEKFTNQSIPDCLQISDIHLYNPQNEKEGLNYLKIQLVKYISLIQHPGLITPTHEERCMQIALTAKVNSGCLSRQVGAVVTDSNYSIKSIGWNDVPEGQISCSLRNMEKLLRNDDVDSFSEYELTDPTFRQYIVDNTSHKLTRNTQDNNESNTQDRFFSYCFKDIQNGIDGEKNQVHTRSLHAEENAFLQLSKYGGEGIKGGYLFTTASPCELCSKKSYQLGIRKIYYIDQYPGISKKHILNNGSLIPKLQLFNGAVGKTYHQIYTPIMALKDELYELFDIKFKPRLIE